MGLLQIERDNLNEAATSLEHAIRLSQIIRDFIFMREAMKARVRLNLLLGEAEAARRSLHNLGELSQHMGDSNPSVPSDGLQARVDRLEGYQSATSDWACGLLVGEFEKPDSSHRILIKDELAIYFDSEQRSKDSAFDEQVNNLLAELAAQAWRDNRLLDWVHFRLLKLSTRIDDIPKSDGLIQLRQVIERSQLAGMRAQLSGAPRLWHLWRLAQEKPGQ